MDRLDHTAPSGQAGALSRVLIVDDHPLFCDALALTLRGIASVRETIITHSLASALATIDAGPLPDVILLDLDLPDVDGLEGFLRLRAAAQGVPILIVSSLSDARVVASVMAGGAAGFVPKHAGRETLRGALESLARGETFVTDGQLVVQQKPGGADALARLSNLTRQQGRILELICQGKQNKQIAWELTIAETTVKAHVTAIMRKLGVQTRTQAVLLAQDTRFKSLVPEA